MRTYTELYNLISLAIGKVSDAGIAININRKMTDIIELQDSQYRSLGELHLYADRNTGDVGFSYLPPVWITGLPPVNDIVVSADELPENKGQQQISAFVLEIYNAINPS